MKVEDLTASLESPSNFGAGIIHMLNDKAKEARSTIKTNMVATSTDVKPEEVNDND